MGKRISFPDRSFIYNYILEKYIMKLTEFGAEYIKNIIIKFQLQVANMIIVKMRPFLKSSSMECEQSHVVFSVSPPELLDDIKLLRVVYKTINST